MDNPPDDLSQETQNERPSAGTQPPTPLNAPKPQPERKPPSQYKVEATNRGIAGQKITAKVINTGDNSTITVIDGLSRRTAARVKTFVEQYEKDAVSLRRDLDGHLKHLRAIERNTNLLLILVSAVIVITVVTLTSSILPCPYRSDCVPIPTAIPANLTLGLAHFQVDSSLDTVQADRFIEEISSGLERQLNSAVVSASPYLTISVDFLAERPTNETQAQRILQENPGLDVLAFGKIENVDGNCSIVLEFRVRSPSFYQAEELAILRSDDPQQGLSRSIRVNCQLDEDDAAQQDIAERVFVLASVYLGAKQLTSESFDTASLFFTIAADEMDGADIHDGRHVVHVLQALTYFRREQSLLFATCRSESRQRAEEQLDLAENELRAAIALDDRYARAYVGLALISKDRAIWSMYNDCELGPSSQASVLLAEANTYLDQARASHLSSDLRLSAWADFIEAELIYLEWVAYSDTAYPRFVDHARWLVETYGSDSTLAQHMAYLYITWGRLEVFSEHWESALQILDQAITYVGQDSYTAMSIHELRGLAFCSGEPCRCEQASDAIAALEAAQELARQLGSDFNDTAADFDTRIASIRESCNLHATEESLS